MNLLTYLLEAGLYLALFYAVYYLLLRKETWYQLNRVYLLSSSFLSFIIPLTQLGILKPAPAGELTRVYINPSLATLNVSHATVNTTPVSSINYYLLVYGIIAFVLTVHFGIRIFQLIKLARNSRRTGDDDFRLVEMDDDEHAFSFFRYMFIGKKLKSSDTIIQHELVHIRQWHSLDIVYLELLKIVCWFNPVVYLLQNSIKELHEYIADSRIVTSQKEVNDYTDFLVSNAYGLPETSLTNNFFNKNLLKNRIMMLHQKRSGSLARLKYLTVLPLIGGMLCVSTLGFTKNYGLVDLVPAHGLLKDSVAKAILRAPKAPAKATLLPPPPPPSAPAAKIKQVTSKGYVYEETGYLVKGKANFRVIITEKDGSQKSYFKSATTAAGLKVLKDKYGYTFPTMAIYPELPPPPPIAPVATPAKTAPVKQDGPANEKTAPVAPDNNQPNDNAQKSEFDGLYMKLAKTIRYPRSDRDNKIQGKVFVVFEATDDHKAKNIRILRTPDAALADEVMRQLSACTLPDAIKTGSLYTMPISFSLLNQDTGKPVDGPVIYYNYPNTNASSAAGLPSVALADISVTSYIK